jgi:hypothetical protein
MSVRSNFSSASASKIPYNPAQGADCLCLLLSWTEGDCSKIQSTFDHAINTKKLSQERILAFCQFASRYHPGDLTPDFFCNKSILFVKQYTIQIREQIKRTIGSSKWYGRQLTEVARLLSGIDASRAPDKLLAEIVGCDRSSVQRWKRKRRRNEVGLYRLENQRGQLD